MTSQLSVATTNQNERISSTEERVLGLDETVSSLETDVVSLDQRVEDLESSDGNGTAGGIAKICLCILKSHFLKVKFPFTCQP